MVATVAFGMGIDKVIFFEPLHESLEGEKRSVEVSILTLIVFSHTA